MLPMDVFVATSTSPVKEDNGQEEVLAPLFLAVGQRAQEYISRIVAEGAEMVLDEILRDTTDTRGSGKLPDEMTHERLDDENHAIFWSKSGVDPFVGVYQKYYHFK